MQAIDHYDSVRPGLVAMLPRLKRFADVLAADRAAGRSLLARALRYMLAEQHLYQRGTALDVWAYSELYRQWRHELSSESEPIAQARVDDKRFGALFHVTRTIISMRPSLHFLAGCRRSNV